MFIGPTHKNHRRSEGATCTSSDSLQVHCAPLERDFFGLFKHDAAEHRQVSQVCHCR
jgi:hypothetical protein